MLTIFNGYFHSRLLPEQLQNLIRDNFKFPKVPQSSSTNDELPEQIPKVHEMHANGTKNGTVSAHE